MNECDMENEYELFMLFMVFVVNVVMPCMSVFMSQYFTLDHLEMGFSEI